jgi:Spy/CpxP family protein refolding chaperone
MKTMTFGLMMLLASAPAFAQGTSGADPAARAEMREQFQQKRLESLSAKLGLDAAGTQALKATFTKYQAQLKPLRQDSWQTRQALKQELAQSQPDQARVSQLTDQLTSNRQKMGAIMQQRQAELRSQLTPEQYGKLLTSHHGFGRGGHGHHRFHGGGEGGGGVQPAAPAPAQ